MVGAVQVAQPVQLAATVGHLLQTRAVMPPLGWRLQTVAGSPPPKRRLHVVLVPGVVQPGAAFIDIRRDEVSDEIQGPFSRIRLTRQ